jgi:uncharacterized damage-inducible protein DinB
MNRNIQITLTIYQRCCDVILSAIDGIRDEHLRWQPAPDSRSIAEICRHLLRVDGWYLQQMGIAPLFKDPESNALPAIQSAMKSAHQQIRQIVQSLKADGELLQIRKAPAAQKEFTFEYAVKHIAQHYLYHAAQIIYLRRAQDRNWPAPLTEWETAADAISKFTWQK